MVLENESLLDFSPRLVFCEQANWPFSREVSLLLFAFSVIFSSASPRLRCSVLFQSLALLLELPALGGCNILFPVSLYFNIASKSTIPKPLPPVPPTITMVTVIIITNNSNNKIQRRHILESLVDKVTMSYLFIYLFFTIYLSLSTHPMVYIEPDADSLFSKFEPKGAHPTNRQSYCLEYCCWTDSQIFEIEESRNLCSNWLLPTYRRVICHVCRCSKYLLPSGK